MNQRKSTFSVLFFIKRKKLLKNGDAPVYMRVTIDGRFLEVSMKRGVNPKTWNEKRQRSTGRDRLSLELNDYLDDTLARILKIHQRFIDEKKLINPKTILDAYAGHTELSTRQRCVIHGLAKTEMIEYVGVCLQA